MLDPRHAARSPAAEFSVSLRRLAGVHVVEVGGSVGILGASLLASRLLALLNDGARELILDLEAARPLAPGALLATVLRIDRYAQQRGARLVTVIGPGTRRALERRGARWLTMAGSMDEALGRLRG